MVKKVINKTVNETASEENSRRSNNLSEKKRSSSTRKKAPSKRISLRPKNYSSNVKRMNATEREELLIENFVGLQHAMTNLSIKFGALSDNLSKLLLVYEEAAKNYALTGKTDNEDMLRKINSLLDQNKTIAKGLVLMEAKLRSGSEGYAPSQPPQNLQVPVSSEKTKEPEVQREADSSQPRLRPRPLPSI